MKLIARIDKVYHGETKMGTGPHGGHRGHAYLADVDIFQDKIVEFEDGRTWPIRKFTGDFLSDVEPTKEDCNKLCEWSIEKYKQELIKALEAERNAAILNEKLNRLTKQAREVVVIK